MSAKQPNAANSVHCSFKRSSRRGEPAARGWAAARVGRNGKRQGVARCRCRSHDRRGGKTACDTGDKGVAEPPGARRWPRAPCKTRWGGVASERCRRLIVFDPARVGRRSRRLYGTLALAHAPRQEPILLAEVLFLDRRACTQLPQAVAIPLVEKSIGRKWQPAEMEGREVDCAAQSLDERPTVELPRSTGMLHRPSEHEGLALPRRRSASHYTHASRDCN